MTDLGVTHLVFSSSAATYGTPDVDLVTEQTATRPESPYGESKLIGEWLIRDVARVARPAAHLAAVLQRGRVGVRRPLRHQPAQPLPARAQGADRGPDAEVFGTDYPTPDGSCVRDYVHVRDLARRARRRRRRGSSAASRSSRLQPRQRRRRLGPADHGRRRAGSPASTSRPNSRPAAGRPGPDRGLGGARRPRPRLADAARRRRHGGLRLAGLAACPGGPAGGSENAERP